MTALRWRTVAAAALPVAGTFASFTSSATAAVPAPPGRTLVWADDFTGAAHRSDFQPPAIGKLRVEARIQMPNVTGAAARGYWPAFWMLGAPYRGNWWNWPMVGEIDILEKRAEDKQTCGPRCTAGRRPAVRVAKRLA